MAVEIGPAADNATVGVRAEDLLEALRDWMRQAQSVLVCYSGGVDSAFVLAVAHEQLGARAIGMTAVSNSLAAAEREDAQRVAQHMGANHRFVFSNELARSGYVANGPDRCFHCKTELYDIAEAKRQEWRLNLVVNGTNRDDLGDYRPGLKAAENAAVRSPLVELGFTKQDVRDAAKLIALEVWSKPAAACLASRLPFGAHVTPERLQQIEHFEAALRELGFAVSRVRWHEHIARIEVAPEDLSRFAEPSLRERVVEAGKAAGFTYVTLDLQGYRTGSHNELLEGRALKVMS